MVYVALAFQLIFLIVAFVFRTLSHLGRTGSTGFRAGAQRSPAELLGAGGITVAALLSGAGVILLLGDAVNAVEFLNRPVINGLGVGAALAGIALVFAGQADMGASWRIGVDQKERTELVTTGLFRWTRNPIFLGMLLFWAGVALMVPNIVTIVSLLVATAAVEVQVRIVEEPYLLRVHGDSYRHYTARTSRLLPGLGRISRRSGGALDSLHGEVGEEDA